MEEKSEPIDTFKEDAYRAGAAMVLDIPTSEVTVWERRRFKQAFFKAFRVKAAALIETHMELLDEAYGEATETSER